MAFANIRGAISNAAGGAAPQQAVSPIANAAVAVPPRAEMGPGGSLAPGGQLPSGADPSKFKMNPDGTVSYISGPNQTRIPASYFTTGQYQADLNQYGIAAGPGFIFNPEWDTWEGSGFKPHANGDYSGDGLYQQDEYGGVIGYSPTEQSRRNAIDSAYKAMLSGDTSQTDFSVQGKHPDHLGQDVLQGLAQFGRWSPPNSDSSGRNRIIEARIDPNGNIIVSDPRGGDGANPLYIYGPDGKFLEQQVGSKAMSPVQGVASVVGAAAGFGALGAASGAGGLGYGAGSAGGSGAFLGEGAASGIPGWDAALTQAPSWTAAGGLVNPALETASEGFGPEFESSLVNQGLTNPFLEQPFDLTPNPQALDFPQLPPGVPPPANPFAPKGALDTLKDFATSQAGKALIGQGINAIGSLAGAAGAAGGGGAGDAQAAQQAEEDKKKAARDKINGLFAGRDGLYQSVRDNAFNSGKRRLDENETDAARHLKFSLFAQGLNGGSEDVEQGSKLGRTYSQGILDLGAKADAAKAGFRANDEDSRQQLLSAVDAGVDEGSALSTGANRMKIAADQAAADANGVTVGNIFDNAGLLYSQSQAALGKQAGQAAGFNMFPQSGATNKKNTAVNGTLYNGAAYG